MNPRFIYPLFVLLSINLYGQKVKVKKDIIHINKVEMYRIVELSHGLLGQQKKAILSIEKGDTLVWLGQRFLVNTKADHETEERTLRYWELTFKGCAATSNYISTQKDDIYKDLIFYTALSNQAVDKAGLDYFDYKTYPKALDVDLFQQAIEQRKILLDTKGYAAYAKLNVKRSPNAVLENSNDIVMFRSSESSVPVNLGRVEFYEGENEVQGYKVYRSTDQKLVATIEFDYYSKSMNIHADFDKDSITLKLRGGQYSEFLLSALRYLTDAGYL